MTFSEPSSSREPSAPDAPHVRAAVIAVYTVFLLAGVQFAAFAARIPQVKDLLGLSAGELGVTLLAVSAGSILGLPAAGWVVHRFGAARTVLAGVIASVLALATVGATTEILHSRPLTMAALFFAGLGIGIWDMSMNLEGATVERAAGRAIMPRFHAAFSAGTVFSALVGSGLTALGVGVLPHLAGTSLVVLLAALWATPRFITNSIIRRCSFTGSTLQTHATLIDYTGTVIENCVFGSIGSGAAGAITNGLTIRYCHAIDGSTPVGATNHTTGAWLAGDPTSSPFSMEPAGGVFGTGDPRMANTDGWAWTRTAPTKGVTKAVGLLDWGRQEIQARPQRRPTPCRRRFPEDSGTSRGHDNLPAPNRREF